MSVRGEKPGPAIADRVAWDSFLARHDLVWDSPPSGYGEAPFLGNGLIGTMLTAPAGTNTCVLEVFRSDVHDHRDGTHGWTAYSRPRFVIGWFELRTVGAVTGCSLRLDLWNAELRGSIETDAGSIGIRHIVHADEPLILFETSGRGGESEARWEWVPGEAKTTRGGVPYGEPEREEFAVRYGAHYRETLRLYEPNPDPRHEHGRGSDVWIQDLLAGGGYATAWREDASGRGRTILSVSIAHTFPERRAGAEALAAVESAAPERTDELYRTHRERWHRYYPLSFLSITDSRLESFYWIQMYKLACSTGRGRPVMDTSGPWFQPTPWPYITPDLNIQLCYWPVYASNRLELGESLLDSLREHLPALVENVRPVEWQEDSAFLHITTAQDLVGPRDDDMRYWLCVGNLAWTLHDCWLHYRHAMDDSILSETIFPLLRRAVNFYRHLLYEDERGVLHLSETYSPEYPVNPSRDTSYDLALLRWGCLTLLSVCERLGIDDPLSGEWARILEHLADFPVDGNGFRIGADTPFGAGHRHFSHLLMVYPLYLLNVEQEGVSEQVRRSVRHWIGSGALAGYSFTGASSMSSAIGEANAALEYLKGLEPYLKPNTLYVEAGPCLETPLAAAQSIHDMLIQSWGGVIRIFPAAPDAWPDIVMHDFRAEGGFLVSAVRSGGETRWVRIESLAGEPCMVKVEIEDPVVTIDGAVVSLELPPGGPRAVTIGRGQTALIRRRDMTGECVIEPVAHDTARGNPFGVRKQ